MPLHQSVFPQQNSRVLVFIDAGVNDYQRLKNDVQPGVEVFILHPEVDGIEQITDIISQYDHIASIHIVSHGAPGTLYLGNTELSLDTLKYYSSKLQNWFNSTSQYLTPALVLYGCNVAATDAGSEFLEKLHQLTKATVYASSTPVGNSALGGNWNLDVSYGQTTPDSLNLIFQPEILETYSGVFAVTSSGTDNKYKYYDSTDLSGKGKVAFNDISSSGTPLTVARDQQSQVQLPFSFNFYGQSFQYISVGENGGLAFIPDGGAAQFRANNADIPSTASNVQQNSIFPFWDDLVGGQANTTGKIYYKNDTNSNSFIIQWSNFAHYDLTNSSITFQVVLYKDSNNIDFVYQDAIVGDATLDYGKSASIGLNKGSDNGVASGLKYSVNEASLNGVTSIHFVTEPRLVTNTFSVKEGETVTLTPNNFNATDIDNNDPSKITYNISNLQKGQFKLNGSVVTQFTQKDINDLKVQFIHDGGEDAPSFSISVTDGFNPSSPINISVGNQTINFTNVNDNPELTNVINSRTFNENALNANAAIIYDSITVSDVDSPDFNGGNLTIAYTNGAAQEDRLSISNTSSITLNGSDIRYNNTVIGTVDVSNNGSNGKSLVINFTNTNATLAAVKALIESLTYQNTSNIPNASRTISVTVNDGDGGTSTPVTTLINVTAENDAPVNNIPTAPSVNEDGTLIFAGSNLISISDPDAGSNLVQVKLEATEGILHLNSITGLDFTGGIGDGTDAAVMEFKGSIADINKALDGMSYKPRANYNGAASVKVTTQDLGNSGINAVNLKDEDTINIIVKAINDAPVNTVPQSTQNLKEDSELIFSSANGNLIKIEDVDASDIKGTGIVQVTLSATKGVLNLKQTTGIGFAPNNSNGNSTITFTGKVGDINSALDGLSYRGNLNVNGAETLTITTDDLGNYGEGGTLKDTKLVNIAIAPVNDAPVNTVPQPTQNLKEDSELIFSSANGNLISIEDVDASDIKGTGIVQVTLSATKGVLNLKQTAGIGFAANNSNGNSTITFTGKVPDINSALDGLSYRGNLNANGADTLTITTEDLGNYGEGGTLKDTKLVNIAIAPVNDSPVNTVPQAQSVREDSDLIFSSANGNLIKIEDVDASDIKGTGIVQVTLSATKGVLNLKQTTGIGFAPNNSNGNSTITFTGKVGDINSALDGLSYRGNLNVNGADTLTITTEDLGNYGEGGTLKDTKLVNIAIAPVNDAPVNTVPQPTQNLKEDSELIFSSANGNLISIEDVDASDIKGTGIVQVTLSATKGVLNLKQTAGIGFAANNSNGNSTITFTGKVPDINSALDGLSYRGNLNANGADTLTITTEDLGNYGEGGTLKDTKLVNIAIAPVNDSPVNTVPQAQSVREDSDLIFSSANGNLIKIEDVDASDIKGTGIVQVTLSATKGVLNLKQTTGIGFAPNNSNGNSTITFTGKVGDINSALDGLSYRGNLNVNGADTLTITTEDLGNYGEGGTLKDTKLVNIAIAPVNDAPINTVPQSTQNLKEDSELIFSSANGNLIKIEDVDASDIKGTGIVQVTLSATKGVLTLKQTAGIGFAANNSNGNSTITFTGKVPDINSALDGLSYRGNLNANGADTLTITTEDLGNYGEGGTLKDTKLVNIAIAPVNDAPINTVPQAQSVREDSDLIFSSANGNLIKIEDVDASDIKGTGIVQVTLSATKGVLTLKQTTGIGFAANNSNGNSTITFTGKVGDINSALDGLSYRGNLNANGADTLTITTEDLGNYGEGGTLKDTKLVNIAIAPVNDAPINTVPQSTQNLKEDSELIFSSANGNLIKIEDVDASDIKGTGIVQVTLSATKGVLTLKQTAGIGFAANNSNGNSTITFTGKVPDINSALDGLSYRGNLNANGAETLTITTDDLGNYGEGGNLKDTKLVNINIDPVNDAPVNTVPQAQSVREDENLVFSTKIGNSISISDVDAVGITDKVKVTLSVIKGKLALGNTLWEDNNSAEITLTDTQSNINKALEGLTYRGNQDFNGVDTLTITTNDLGNSGEGGALTDTDSVKITVTPVNDPPVNNLPTTQDVNETQNLIFSAETGNAISVEDVDVSEGKGELEVTLSVTKGLLTLGQLTGLTFTVGDGKANAKTTFVGKAVDINKALNGLIYHGEKDFVGKDTLTITTSDLGNFGENGIQIDQDTMTINVMPNKDGDGIDTATEQKVVNEIAKLGSADLHLNNLIQQAIYNGGIVAFFGADGGTKKPTVIAVDQENQKQLGGTSETPALVFSELKTLPFDVAVQNPITVFDDKDPKKASLKKVTAAQDIINFKLIPNPAQTDDNLQQQIKDAIKQKPVKIEIKLPDGPEDIAVNTILRRKADGTLYDFRRELNPQRGQLDDDLLTGAVLQDRNLDGKADWAVVYLQDGEWGNEEGLSDSNTEQSLVAAKLDLGDSRIEVRSNQDGLNFHGNRSFVQFTLNRFSGVDASEVGMARVRFGNNGQITEVDGKAVNSLDEAKQAIIQRGETLFSSLTNKQNPEFGNQNRTIAFEEGEQAVFFVIQNGTKNELLFNGLNSKSVQFSLPSLNNGAGIMTASTDERGQTTKLSLAGLFDIGARILSTEEVKSQLGLLAISQSPRGQVNADSEVIDLKSSGAFDNKQVMLKVSLYREAANNNSAYLYRTDDAKGSIRDPLTGMLIDPTTAALSAEQRQRYLQLATSDRLVKDVQFQGGNLMTTDVSTVIKGGEYYAPLLVSNGTLSSIGNDFSRIFTSYMGINSDRIDHIRNLGNNVFGIEDVIGGGDRDYNDMILSIKQVQVVA